MINKKYGRLYILDQYYKTMSNGYHRDFCLCQCECNSNPKEILGLSIRKGLTTSCGCYQKQRIVEVCKKYNQYNLSGKFGIGYTKTNTEFYFDLDDYEKIYPYSWSYNSRGGIYAHNNIDLKHIKMPNLILGSSNKIRLIDHINKNNRDNRKENLRFATKSQNGMNSKLSKNNKTGVIGIFWDRNKMGYSAYITINGKRIYLIWTKDKIEAIAKRLLAEKKYFGDFAPQKHLFREYGIN